MFFVEGFVAIVNDNGLRDDPERTSVVEGIRACSILSHFLELELHLHLLIECLFKVGSDVKLFVV